MPSAISWLRRPGWILLLMFVSSGCDGPLFPSESDISPRSSPADSAAETNSPRRLSASLAQLESLSPVDTAAKADYFRIGQGLPYNQVVAELGPPDREQEPYTYSVWASRQGVTVVAADANDFVVGSKSGVWLPNSGDAFLVGTDEIQFQPLTQDLGSPDQINTEQRFRWEYDDGSAIILGFINQQVSSMAHHYPAAAVPVLGGQVPGIPTHFNPVAICNNDADCQSVLDDLGRPPALFRFRHAWKDSPNDDCEIINQASQRWVSLYHLIAVLGTPDGETSRATRYIWNRGDGRLQLSLSHQDDRLRVENRSADGSDSAFATFQAQLDQAIQGDTVDAATLQDLTPPDRMELLVNYTWRYSDRAVEVAVDRGRVVGCNGVQ